MVLGSFCLVFLILGHWLKRLAGQASDSYRLTSESHFISQLERVQSRYEQQDIEFLTTRVFGDPVNRRHAQSMLEEQIRSARTGVPVKPDPALLIAALEELGVDGAADGSVWMVGDSGNDVLGGRAIGATTIGVRWGLVDPEKLETFKPDAMLSEFAELLGLIR